MVNTKAEIIIRGVINQLIGKKKWGIMCYYFHGRIGFLLSLVTLTTAIIVKIKMMAIDENREIEDGAVIEQMEFRDVNSAVKWEREGWKDIFKKINVKIDNKIKKIKIEGRFNFWFGERATK